MPSLRAPSSREPLAQRARTLLKLAELARAQARHGAVARPTLGGGKGAQRPRSRRIARGWPLGRVRPSTWLRRRVRCRSGCRDGGAYGTRSGRLARAVCEARRPSRERGSCPRVQTALVGLGGTRPENACRVIVWQQSSAREAWLTPPVLHTPRAVIQPTPVPYTGRRQAIPLIQPKIDVFALPAACRAFFALFVSAAAATRAVRAARIVRRAFGSAHVRRGHRSPAERAKHDTVGR